MYKRQVLDPAALFDEQYAQKGFQDFRGLTEPINPQNTQPREMDETTSGCNACQPDEHGVENHIQIGVAACMEHARNDRQVR